MGRLHPLGGVVLCSIVRSKIKDFELLVRCLLLENKVEARKPSMILVFLTHKKNLSFQFCDLIFDL